MTQEVACTETTLYKKLAVTECYEKSMENIFNKYMDKNLDLRYFISVPGLEM